MFPPPSSLYTLFYHVSLLLGIRSIKSEVPYEWNDLVMIQSEDGSFMCHATPKNSGGEYLYIGCWEIEQKSTITKTMLRSQFQQGQTLNDILAFGPGQDCEIFKADRFYPGDTVIYVSDVYLNHIPLDRSITDPEDLA